MIDGSIRALGDRIIAAIPEDAPFDMAMAALEYALARRLLAEAPPMDMQVVAVQMVSRHLAAIMLEMQGR